MTNKTRDVQPHRLRALFGDARSHHQAGSKPWWLRGVRKVLPLSLFLTALLPAFSSMGHPLRSWEDFESKDTSIATSLDITPPSVAVRPETSGLGWWQPVESVWWDVGHTGAGGWSPWTMLQAWRAAGMTPEEAHEAMSLVLEELRPTWFRDPQDPRRIEREEHQRILAQALQETYPEIHERLMLQREAGVVLHGTKRMRPENASSSLADIRERLADQADHVPSTWEEVEALIWAEEVRGLRRERNHAALGETWGSWNQAQHQLEATLLASGLAEFSFSPAYLDRPSSLIAIEEKLRLGHEQMRANLGWEGPVMGLNGRIRWELTNTELGQQTAYMEWAPETQGIVIRADWQSWNHEWVHALDFTLGLQAQVEIPLSEWESEVLSSSSSDYQVLWQAWKNVKEQLHQDTSWLMHRKQHYSAHQGGFVDRHYASNPVELMAFSFEAVMSADPTSVFYDANAWEDPTVRNIMFPSDATLANVKELWSQALAESRVALGEFEESPVLAMDVARVNASQP